MTDPFHSSKYSIEHAKRRVAELEGEVAAFLKSDPYASVVEFNPNGPEDIHKIKLTKPMPAPLQGIAFDAANGLRAALDQAGYAVAVAAGKSGKSAHFPFGDTPDEVHRRHQGGSKQIPQEIFDLMVSFKPYKGGDDLLWALNKLCNSHKHEIIIPVGMATGFMNVDASGPLRNASWPPRWDRLKHEMVMMRTPHGRHPQYNFQFHFYVALAKVDVVDGQPADAVLNQLVGIVESIVAAIEAEARRINLIH